MKTSTWITLAFVVGILVILFMWPRFMGPNSDLLQSWKTAGIDCIGGHQNLAQHIHAVLVIRVDGASETIPANLGIVPSCMAEVHTHDASGTLHIETLTVGKQLHLKHFFAVYGMPFERSGYTASLIVDGQPSADGAELILRDKQMVELVYTPK